MWGWCIVTLVSARLKASVRLPPLRGMYQRGGTSKGCDTMDVLGDTMGLPGVAMDDPRVAMGVPVGWS